ncbi:MAG: hypothetical protein JXR22_01515 [Prolixibacteraceae bacterium]|nr:hypothetical protein [Prolixibacteraceae bacterium]
MQAFIRPLFYFVSGALLMMAFQSLTQCIHDDDFLKNSINPQENAKIDYKAIDRAVNDFEEAFKDAEQSSIDALSWDESLEHRELTNEYYSSEELEEIGKAMRRAKLVSASANYAEYAYSIGNATFTFSMALDVDGKWKLLRY